MIYWILVVSLFYYPVVQTQPPDPKFEQEVSAMQWQAPRSHLGTYVVLKHGDDLWQQIRVGDFIYAGIDGDRVKFLVTKREHHWLNDASDPSGAFHVMETHEDIPNWDAFYYENFQNGNLVMMTCVNGTELLGQARLLLIATPVLKVELDK